ncbi:MAG: PDZ domain-containing protein, partial [Bdellovibrionales bacterium]|nr:PDZ domain-containing protein [Bdellovibrionales bacterium]
NTKGYVIGVNTAIDARAQGVGFTIPSNYVKKIVAIIKKGETIRRGYLGIGLATLTNRAARNFGIKKGGVVVTQVQKNSPAQKAGFKTYDIITEFNQKRIRSSEELATNVQDTEIGSKAKIKILRSVNDRPYKERVLTVTIGTFPEKGKKAKPKFKNNYEGQKAPYNLGFSRIDSSSGARLSFDVPVNSPFGPIVNDIDYEGVASKAGLQRGDILLEINRKTVNDATSAIQLMKKGTNTFLVHRNGQTTMIFVESE